LVAGLSHPDFSITPQGVFNSSDFFKQRHPVLDGNRFSETRQEHLKNIIKSETTAKTLHDQEIADMLKEHNIDVARQKQSPSTGNVVFCPLGKEKKPSLLSQPSLTDVNNCFAYKVSCFSRLVASI